MSNPLVSIIITSYNRRNYISEAIRSVLDQDYQNIEVIIIDNCSTDNSEEVIIPFFGDLRVTFVKNSSNIGAVPSMNKAISLARGVYFTHVSSDDYLINKSFISDAVNHFDRFPNCVVVTGKNIFFDESDKKYTSPGSYSKTDFFNRTNVEGSEVFLEYLNTYPITMGACIMNREKFLQLDQSRAAPIYYDLQIIMQLLLLGDAGFIDKEVYLVRIHGKNLSSSLPYAEVYIDNYSFIEVPYKLASSLNTFSRDVLDGWHTTMLEKYSFYILCSYYKKDKAQFRRFNDFVKNTYPTIYNKIKTKPKWHLILVFYMYPYIGAAFNKLNLLFNRVFLSNSTGAN